jgi:S1-C subfamily serine protease
MKATAHHSRPSAPFGIFQAARNGSVRALRLGWALGLSVSLILFACASAVPGSIGAMLGKKDAPDGRVFVREVPAGLAAANAGLEVDDEILTIDGVDVRPISKEEVSKKLRGDVGTTVVLTVSRAGQKREVKVVRTAFVPVKK